MRILFCNYEYPPLGGGGGIVNAMLAEALAERHEVAVLTSLGLGLTASENRNNVDVYRVPVFFRRAQAVANLGSMLSFVPQAVRHGRRLLARRKFDVMNTHFAVPTGPAGHLLARRAGLPNVLSLHGGDLYDPSKTLSPHRHAILRTTVRWVLKRADAIVGQSTNTIENMHRYYGPAFTAEQIPLGIRRPPQGAAASRDEHGLDSDDVLLITVGRLVARKAVGQLIDLLADLPRRVKLLILGDGPRQDALHERVRQNNLQDRVRFFGHVAEKKKFPVLRMCDLFVSTSQHEGFGLVFLEAMACGLPVVCYAHGGQTDYLEHDTTGGLLPLNDQAGFRRACEALVSDPARRRQIGAHNRQRCEEFFIDACAQRYETLFERVIEEHRRGQ